MSEAITRLKAASLQLEAAHKEVEAVASEALHDALTEVFKNKLIYSVGWGQRSSEYNDEGLYDGITGPFLNPMNSSDPDELLEDKWAWISTYGGSTFEAPVEGRLLTDLLKMIPIDVMATIIEEGYEAAVVAVRTPDGFKLYSRYAGY